MYTESDIISFFKRARETYNNYYDSYNKISRRFFRKARFEYELYKKVKKEIDKYLSTDFNFLDIIRPSEDKISDLIKILLEPNGIHGQGSIFLDLFLNQLKNLWEGNIADSYEKVSIIREKTTDLLEKEKKDRRIDILIEIEKFVIGIENKPRADEQNEQLDDYFKYLQKRSNSKKDFLLIFLPGTKREPMSISDNNKNSRNFINVTYKELLIPWLEECYKNCESQKVRFFIKDFIDWINKNFKEAEEF